MESLELVRACLIVILVIIAYISIELMRAPVMKDDEDEEKTTSKKKTSSMTIYAYYFASTQMYNSGQEH